jgi:hypoxanthine phosphoribosyltransferase
VDAAQIGNELTSIVLTTEQIDNRIREIAAQIDTDYASAEKPVLMVGVLKGAVMVMADLARAVSIPVEFDFMAVSSYGSGTKSSGVVRIIKDLDIDLAGRDVLIVEDILDSGLTLSW